MSVAFKLLRVATGMVGLAIGAASLSLPAACEVCGSEPFQPNGSFAVVSSEDYDWESAEFTLSDDTVELVYTMNDGSMWRTSWRIAPPPS